jgi:hypothetical protein
MLEHDGIASSFSYSDDKCESLSVVLTRKAGARNAAVNMKHWFTASLDLHLISRWVANSDGKLELHWYLS